MSTARLGINGSIAFLTERLVNTFSSVLFDGIPPMLCGVSRSGTNPG